MKMLPYFLICTNRNRCVTLTLSPISYRWHRTNEENIHTKQKNGNNRWWSANWFRSRKKGLHVSAFPHGIRVWMEQRAEYHSHRRFWVPSHNHLFCANGWNEAYHKIYVKHQRKYTAHKAYIPPSIHYCTSNFISVRLYTIRVSFAVRKRTHKKHTFYSIRNIKLFIKTFAVDGRLARTNICVHKCARSAYSLPSAIFILFY